jgi:mRNA-degrading endonuclease toxin of MazEF toxin-antitoxin module
MMFILRLLTLPVTGPVRGLQFILEVIRDQALAEMLTEDQIQTLLIESSLRHQAGEITDEEYEEVETALLEHLNTIRALNSEAYYDYPEQYHE